MKLDRGDQMEAVTEGVRRALVDVLTGHGRYDLPQEFFTEGIRQGTADAIWKIATIGVALPSEDFYEAITEGVAKGMEKVRTTDR